MAARAKSAALPWAAFRLVPPLCIGRAAGGFFYPGWAMTPPACLGRAGSTCAALAHDHKN